MSEITAFSRERLLNDLDQPRRIHWAVDLKFGTDALKFLLGALSDRSLNRQQTFNAMHALFRIKDHGRLSDVLGCYVQQAQSSDRLIRSEAIVLSLGLISFTNNCTKEKIALAKGDEVTIRAAIQKGITPKAKRAVERFFEKETPNTGLS